MTTPTDAHGRALSAALKACAAWDVPMQPEVLPKIIGVYLGVFLKETGVDLTPTPDSQNPLSCINGETGEAKEPEGDNG